MDRGIYGNIPSVYKTLCIRPISHLESIDAQEVAMMRDIAIFSLLMIAFCVALVPAQVTDDTVAYYSFDGVKDRTVRSATGKLEGKSLGILHRIKARNEAGKAE